MYTAKCIVFSLSITSAIKQSGPSCFRSVPLWYYITEWLSGTSAVFMPVAYYHCFCACPQNLNCLIKSTLAVDEPLPACKILAVFICSFLRKRMLCIRDLIGHSYMHSKVFIAHHVYPCLCAAQSFQLWWDSPKYMSRNALSPFAGYRDNTLCQEESPMGSSLDRGFKKLCREAGSLCMRRRHPLFR